MDCEVYGQFADLLPASLIQEDGELQWGRARQGKVPDFKFLLPTPDGPKSALAELKVLSCGKTWYPRGVKGKGTSRQAARLSQEYIGKLRDLDSRFHGTAIGASGPLVSRFLDLGGLERGCLVAGPFGDVSPDFHQLIQILAESRTANLSRAQGFDCSEGFLRKITGEIRRSLSTTIIRASAESLLERLQHISPAAGAAAKRRADSLKLEFRRRREREAVEAAWRARGSCRIGRAFV